MRNSRHRTVLSHQDTVKEFNAFVTACVYIYPLKNNIAVFTIKSLAHHKKNPSCFMRGHLSNQIIKL